MPALVLQPPKRKAHLCPFVGLTIPREDPASDCNTMVPLVAETHDSPRLLPLLHTQPDLVTQPGVECRHGVRCTRGTG